MGECTLTAKTNNLLAVSRDPPGNDPIPNLPTWSMGGETEHSIGMHSQKEFAVYFAATLIIIIMSILFSNYAAHHKHWYFLPEAAGYTMKRRFFFDNITAIVTYAVAGTTISSFVVGVIVYIAGYAGASLKMTLAESLSFGALISATEPTLFYLVFGESSLNDAVAIVLFASFSKFIGNSFTASAIPLAIFDFTFIFVGSTLVGIVFGMLSALLFKHYNFKGCLYQEIGVYIMFTYLPFAVCTVVDLSGVVAILFTGTWRCQGNVLTGVPGISMKHYTCNNLSDEGKASYVLLSRPACWCADDGVCHRVAKFFNAISYVSEATIFLNLGLAVFSLEEGFHLGFTVCTLVACLVGRALHVYPLTYLINTRKTEERKIPLATQHMIWFSGLRGALCFALALEWPNELQRQEIITVTMVIVLVTLFIGGGATVPVLNFFKIKRLTPTEELEIDQNVRPMKRMRILQFDAKYLVPFFTHMHPDVDGNVSKAAVAASDQEESSKNDDSQVRAPAPVTSVHNEDEDGIDFANIH
ncbi:hypothetical protein DYB32_000391 [Aphanomyces invadans]|uniref:Sodium/hydrogen exchanger 8 n=1 Tax=Aphanomyces invadans TaxID=157072 RepID=A0A3R6VIA3_9STRA|nr:hypothetical protein DYB32_000391 [Aphanomyces invadans]